MCNVLTFVPCFIDHIIHGVCMRIYVRDAANGLDDECACVLANVLGRTRLTHLDLYGTHAASQRAGPVRADGDAQRHFRARWRSRADEAARTCAICQYVLSLCA